MLVAALATVPAVAVLMLANAPGGIDGQVSKVWTQATDPAVSGADQQPGAADRRPRQAARATGARRCEVHAQAPVLGTGAGAYGTLRLRYRLDARQVRHAHGYVVQTLADLGWVGLGLSLLAAFTWLGTVARTLGDAGGGTAACPGTPNASAWPRWPRSRSCSALHSACDWTWFVPGNVAAGAAVRRVRGLARDAARAGLRGLR